MRMLARICLHALAGTILGGCAAPLVMHADLPETCRVAVVEKFGQPQLIPHAGAGKGAVAGALTGLQIGGAYAGIILAPIGGVIGGMYGSQCEAEFEKFPGAEAVFEKTLREADTGMVRREIEASLNAPRPGCVAAGPNDAWERPAGTRITIEKLTGRMACPEGKQRFSVGLDWYAEIVKSNQKIAWMKTIHVRTSPLDVGPWLSDPAAARAEIELVYVELGRKIAAELVGEEALAPAASPTRK